MLKGMRGGALALVTLVVSALAPPVGAGEVVQATVQRVDGAAVELDVGSRHGVAVGARFQVLSQGKVIRIPLTGTVTYQEGSPIGIVRVVEVYPTNSRCLVESIDPGKQIAPGLDAVLLGAPAPSPPAVPAGVGSTAPPAGATAAAPVEVARGPQALAAPAGPAALQEPVKLTLLADPGRPSPGQEVRLSVQGLEAAGGQRPGLPPGAKVRWSATGGCLMAEETSSNSVSWIAPRAAGRSEIRAEVLLAGGRRLAAAGVIETAGEPALPDKASVVNVFGPNAFGGEMLRVRDAAFDEAGNLYLLDSRLRCVFCLGRGAAIREAVSRKACADAGVKDPVALAVREGRLYLLDSAPPCVKVFDLSDKPAMKMGENVRMSEPVDIAADARGTVYVVDRGMRCFHVFDSNGIYLNVRGRRGQGLGEFESPAAVAVAPNGNVLVLDRARKDIQVFDQSHRVVSKFGARVQPGNTLADIDISADGKSVYVLEGDRGQVARYSESGELQLYSAQDEARFPNMPAAPAKLAVDPFGRVHVVPRSRVGVYRYGPDGLPEGRFAADEPGRPIGIAADDQGMFAILDAEPPYVRLYDPDGWLVCRFGVPTDVPVAFRMPRRIAMIRRGRGVATLGQGSRGAFDEPVEMPMLNVFDEKGTRIRHLGSRGTAPGQFVLPADIDADREGNVYVLDRDILRVSVFSWKGAGATPERERTFRSGSRLAEEMLAPDRLAVDPDTGDMYVYDAKTRLIKKFTKDAIYVGTCGADMGFQAVERMRVDTLGLLWVFDKRLQELRRIDFRGATGSVSLTVPLKAISSEPLDFGLDASGRIYVLTARDLVYLLR